MRRRGSALAAMMMLLLIVPALSRANPEMRLEDRVRIREAMRIADLYGDRIWPGLKSAPFAIILVTDSVEFLLNHPHPSQEFVFLHHDSLIGSNVYYRRAFFDKHLFATFPAVNGLNTIVVGTPETTGKNSTDWIITLLHEHFHQFVYSSPDYYGDVDRLGLSDGDKTGMWMLNYPFPYTDSALDDRYERYAAALSRTAQALGTTAFDSLFEEYRARRNELRRSLRPRDYQYLSFQIWQEGVARYTEYKFLQLLDRYTPSREAARLPDFVPFPEFRKTFLEREMNFITSLKLKEARRVCVYSIGFAEGLILDRLNPAWRDKYLKEKFSIDRYAEALTPVDRN